MQTRSNTLSLFTRNSSLAPSGRESVYLAFAKQDNLQFSTPAKTRRLTEPSAPVKRARRQLIEDLRDACDNSDNDSTSTYHTEDDEPITPRNLCDLFEPNFIFEGNLLRNTDNCTTEERAKYAHQRSSEEQKKYAVEIDFDEASRAWRVNKVLAGECNFAYKCDKCDRRSVKDSNYCGVHRRGAAKKVK